MDIKQIHHVAYRCKDAKETVEFYQNVLGMDFLLAIAEDLVPSTKEPDPYMHVFLDAGNGNIIAFFEIPNSPEMGRDENTPAWVQHIAFEVEDEATMMRAMEKAKAAGLEVVGPTDHTIIKSIYFFDPNNIPLEISCQTMEIVKPPVLADPEPSEFALEGSEPQPGHWPEVTHPTPPEQWTAHPGNGFEIRRVALREQRGKAVGE